MPRVPIPFIGPHYSSRQKGLSAQTAKNMWPEINPEARNQVALHNTAGLKVFATLSGIDRGLHDFNNLLYAVNGTMLYSIDAEGTNTDIGTIPGTARCVMANDSTQLIITTGATPFRYTVAGGLEAITDPDLVNPTTVSYINQQFVFDQNAGVFGEFVTSSIEAGLSVDALDFAQAESHPDDILEIKTFRQYVYFFGSHSVEAWQNTGTGNPPFARVNSSVQPYGVAGPNAVISTYEFMYFLDNQRIPRRSNGLSFTNVGNPALGVEFAKYSTIDDVIAFEFVQDNQQFFALTFPTANRTWCFHEPSGSWFQLMSGVDDDRHRASSMINIYGLNYCADHTNGLIYEYSLDIFSDNGSAIIKQRDTATIHGGLYEKPGKKLFFNEVEFTIVSGETEVAGTGLGAQPVPPETGVCGTVLDLTQGDLLSPVEVMNAHGSGFGSTNISQGSPAANGVNMANSKAISFTCFFKRTTDPTAGTKVHAIDLFDSDGAATNFGFYIDENGYMNITGRNAANVEILNAQITNNGSSFSDSVMHEFAVVINMDDESKREIYHNAVNITESSWVTWNTYVDDEIELFDVATANDMTYSFGASTVTLKTWHEPLASNTDVGAHGIGFVSFDNACTLIASAVWDANGWVRDPQKWEGWYKSQPKFFYGPSFARNTGTTEPATYAANDTEVTWLKIMGFDGAGLGLPAIQVSSAGRTVNEGIGSVIEATAGGALPSAPAPDPRSEIVAPLWLNEGNWIDLSKLSQTTFNGMFGVEIENADFNNVTVVNKAALVNTSDAGNRLQIQDTNDCANAALYVVDNDGDVVDSMIYAGAPNGDSVLVPTGANYYVVITSDTGNAKVKKWDTTQISTVGSVSWESYFGQPFALGIFFGNITKTIPAEGLSIRFTIPVTSTAYKLSISMLEVPSNPGIRTGAINQTVLDFTSGATRTWGLGGGIDGGINFAGQDIDLIPGETYFFNIKKNEPLATNNFVTIQAFTLEQ